MTDTETASTKNVEEARTRNLCAVKGVFTGEYNGARGCFLLVMDLDRIAADRVLVLIITDAADFRFQASQEWRSFQDAIIAAKLQGKAAHQMSMEVQSYIQKVVRDDRAAEICTAIRTGNREEIKRSMTDMISKAIADAQVLMDISFELVNEVLPKESAVAVTDDAPEDHVATGEPAVVKDVVLKVSPILAPVNGVPARHFKPGQVMTVTVKEQTTLKANVLRLLSLKNTGADRGTIQGTVKAIEPAEENRVKITLELAPNIFGTAKILGELKVQASATQKTRTGKTIDLNETEPSGITTSTFTMAAILIFTIMAFLAYLIFGGVI